MEDTKLILMANHIAAQFQSYTDNECAARIAKHLNTFWSPEMRTQLMQYTQKNTAYDTLHRCFAAVIPLLKK